MSKLALGSAAGFAFQSWLRSQVRHPDKAPALPREAAEVVAYQAAVRRALELAAGPKPEYAPLEATIHQVQQRQGYRIEAISFPTFAGLTMTANAYVPEAAGPVPGVLVVHGHWPHGRRDPQVQYRCLALVKSGYFVLAVDCFGAGERAVTLPGAYHGGLQGASLWLTGYSLFGIQIHENVRACDYLASRPEVDPGRLAITGASGGGNQAFYTGAYDPRFQAVVPVCSVGSYKQMVGNSNCICETPEGLAGTLEQSDILALIAPRAALVMNALDDSITFWHEEAEATVNRARPVWELLGHPEKLDFRAYPTRHGYWPPYREALLGWLDRWLKGEATDTPRPEPPVEVEDLHALACFPKADQPQVMTVPALFAATRDRLLAAQTQQEADVQAKVDGLRQLLGVNATATALQVERLGRAAAGGSTMGLAMVCRSADGLMLPTQLLWSGYRRNPERALLWLGESKEAARECPAARAAMEQGMVVWAVDLPGLGEATLPGEPAGGARTNASAVRGCHMLGFSLAGLWLRQIQALLATLRQSGAHHISIAASAGPASIVLIGSALLEGVERILVRGPLASYQQLSTFDRLPMEVIIPGLLGLGDVSQIAAWRAPHRLTVAAPVSMHGEPLTSSQREAVFAVTRDRYARLGHPEAFRLIGPEEVQSGLGRWL